MFGIYFTGIGTYLSTNVGNLVVSVTATSGSVENNCRVNGAEAERGLSFFLMSMKLTTLGAFNTQAAQHHADGGDGTVRGGDCPGQADENWLGACFPFAIIIYMMPLLFACAHILLTGTPAQNIAGLASARVARSCFRA